MPMEQINKIKNIVIKYKLELYPNLVINGNIKIPTEPLSFSVRNSKLMLARNTDKDITVKNIMIILTASQSNSPFLYKRIDQEKKHKGKIKEAIPKD